MSKPMDELEEAIGIALRWKDEPTSGFGPNKTLGILARALLSSRASLVMAEAKAALARPEGAKWQEGRPPNDEGTYLVANDRGQVCPVVRGIIQNNVGSAWDWEWGTTLTHWMPLPAAPVRAPQEREPT